MHSHLLQVYGVNDYFAQKESCKIITHFFMLTKTLK